MTDQSSDPKATADQPGNPAADDNSPSQTTASDKKQEATPAAAAPATSDAKEPAAQGPADGAQPSGPRKLPTHFRGMPKNWEKNRQSRK